ncbi:hypothetical protein ELI13_18325 [Rhizobium ruizarguesonis]|uniref:hypothetical protein n=1 Tax=Rhizobium TaxID=379 RepID=UPI00102FAA96|nr:MULTISPECIES: hypothetical protein [Rhizobium]NKL65695.1 hypothetical protein [Rhizobium leguminosarum bv. viciae]NKL92193.1 hypothetical protein [Rhizobium leguminosarum bv. viciae]TAW90534.1 hypothetical protein ELI13_18325 [Rhizobium ruizarguesonis]
MGFIDELLSGAQVSSETAKQDRIQFSARRWTFVGTLAEFRTFSERLSDMFVVAGEPRKVFNAQSGMEEYAPRWLIAKGRGGAGYITPAGYPLFSGTLRGWQSRERWGNDDEYSWTLQADLSLNPTRAILHQPIVEDAPDDHHPEENNFNLFAISPTRNIGAIPIVRGNNLLPWTSYEGSDVGINEAHVPFLPGQWNENVRRYIDRTLTLLDECIGAAASAALSYEADVVRQEQRYVLHALETYWEFQDNNPVATIARIEWAMRSLAGKSTVAWEHIDEEARAIFRHRNVELGTEDNSPIVKIYPAKGVMIKAYAKATDRVRFEVEQSKTSSDFNGFGISSDEDVGILHWIAAARSGSALRLNRVLWGLRQVMQPWPGSNWEAAFLVNTIKSNVHDDAIATTLTQSLLQQGSIERPHRSPFSDAIDALVRAKVIYRVTDAGQSGIYHVTGVYRDALRLLSRLFRDNE